jgi:hypothetical protein
MSGSITLTIFLALVVGYALVRHRGRRIRDPWRHLSGLSPVSGQWLADYRRSR